MIASTPTPTVTALVATLIRAGLYGLGACGIMGGTTLSDSSLMTLAGSLVLVGTTGWSLYDRFRMAWKAHQAALASAAAGVPMKLMGTLLAIGLTAGTLTGCGGGAAKTVDTVCHDYSQLSWLLDLANSKFAGKYAADVAIAQDLLVTAACSKGDWTVRAEMVAVKLAYDLWGVVHQ